MTGTATTSVAAALGGTAWHRGSERRCAPFMSGVEGTALPPTGRTKPITTGPTTTEPTNQNAPTIRNAAVNVAIVPGPRSWSPPV